MNPIARQRRRMVREQIAARGVHAQRVLSAMESVPRDKFLPPSLRERAYADEALPIAEGQTISQPYIVALMAEALGLEGDEKVLEIGTGSGYAAAVLSRLAAAVYTVERIGTLAEKAASALHDLGFRNVHVLHADGTRGWPAHAPYDAIAVAAGGPDVPKSLRAQLALGGRLVMPVGDSHAQALVRVTRHGEHEYETEHLTGVHFVPLVGVEGWHEGHRTRGVAAEHGPREPFTTVEDADLTPLLDRIGDARVVLLGEATHGSAEFYRMRDRITRELITAKGFGIVAVEADWPDAARIDHYVRHFEHTSSEWTAFARFPTWMWRNEEVRTFVDWLRAHNAALPATGRVAFRGLDLYSLYNSIREVLDYLETIDPETAALARQRYGCLERWGNDAATYGQAALTGRYRSCEGEVLRMLTDLLAKRRVYAERDGERFLDAAQNAQLIASAERYYREMYYGSRASWNLRDGYMFETLKNLLAHGGPRSRAVVWAHNSHVGDAAATEMSAHGEYNIGELCRRAFGEAAYLVGFGTDHGTVAAASAWDAPMEIMQVRPALPGSHEQLAHETGLAGFMLGLREREGHPALESMSRSRLQRAIGVVYRPDSERQSHYFEAMLPRQFDEYIWVDQTHAVTPIPVTELEGVPDTYPFGL